MPTNRSFLANFLAAFRAHSAIHKSTSTTALSNTPTTTHTSHVSSSSSSTGPSNPRSISTKAAAPQQPSNQGATTAAVQAAGHLQHTRQHSTSPLSRSPGPSTSPIGTSPSASGGGASFGGRQQAQRRRSSDSSSGSSGFRDVLGQEKWYIGGRTATGEEKFYRLGVVKRHRSIDRLSMDRLSL